MPANNLPFLIHSFFIFKVVYCKESSNKSIPSITRLRILIEFVSIIMFQFSGIITSEPYFGRPYEPQSFGLDQYLNYPIVLPQSLSSHNSALYVTFPYGNPLIKCLVILLA